MDKILEELWYGNIEPTEYNTSACKEYRKQLHLIAQNEDTLLESLTEDQKKLFFRYTDCVREHQATTDCLLFQSSFKLGARIMLEVMRE